MKNFDFITHSSAKSQKILLQRNDLSASNGKYEMNNNFFDDESQLTNPQLMQSKQRNKNIAWYKPLRATKVNHGIQVMGLNTVTKNNSQLYSNS